MAEFCTCGSLIINGKCSKKNCIHRAAAETKRSGKTGAASRRSSGTSSKTGSSGNKSAVSAPAQSTEKNTPSPKKASRCVTYHLDELSAAELEKLQTRERAKAVKPGF